MHNRLHLPSALFGALLLSAGLLAVRSASAQKGAAQQAAAASWEYKMVVDPTEKDLGQLASENWEFAGYLGQSTRGERVDETLWKRPVK